MKKLSEQIKELRDNAAKFSTAAGMDFFDPQPKPNYKTTSSAVVSLLWQTLVWYTIIKHLPSLDILSLSYVHVSFFSQGLMRTVNLILHPFTTTNLQASIFDFYKLHETDNDIRKVLEQAIKTSKKLVYGIITFDCVIFNSGILLLIVFLLTKAYVLLVPIYLPYFNAKELIGYLLNLSLQLVLGAVGFFTFSTYDGIILMYGYHSLTMVEVLKIKMRNLQLQMDVEEKKRKFDDEKNFNQKFIEIVKFHEQINDFNAEFSNLVRIPFATALIVNLFGISLCINMALKKSFALGFGASLGLFVQLLLPFIVAIMQSFQKDRISYEALVFSWDRFKTNENRKNYFHLLSAFRINQKIKVPLNGVLNMKLFMKILFTAYLLTIHIRSVILCSVNY